jgi:SprT-like protein
MSNLPETNEELLELAKSISLQAFHLPFLHDCRYNPRLRSVGGRYLLTTHHIEINWRYAMQVGYDGLIMTIKHELCHYHLHLTGRGYRHRDQDFQLLLKRVNGIRYADRSALNLRTYRYEYQCQSCGMKYMRRNRINLKKFVCGKCRGKLCLTNEFDHLLTNKGDVSY